MEVKRTERGFAWQGKAIKGIRFNVEWDISDKETDKTQKIKEGKQ